MNDWGMAWARETRLSRRSRWSTGRAGQRRSHLVEQARRQRFAEAALGDWVLVARPGRPSPGGAND